MLREHAKAQPPTKEEWIERELAKMPPRSEAWKAETRRLWELRSLSPDDLDERRVEPLAALRLVDDDSPDVAL